MPITIAVCNKKGGVGKTATAVNLASGLVRNNKNVLVIDLDPQHDATRLLTPQNISITYTISDMIEQSDNIKAEKCIYTSDEGVDFIGSSNKLTNTEIRLAGEMYRETILRRLIDVFKSSYDYIIIDCPPSTGLLTINALAAADEIIIPVQANDFSCLDGLNELMKYINITRSQINPGLIVAGILITKYSPVTNITKLVCQKIDELKNIPVFKTKIRLSTTVAETPAVRKTIFEYKASDKAAADYEELAKEVIR